MAVFGLSIIAMLAIRVVVTQKHWGDWIQECRPSSSCYKFIDKEDIWTSAVQYCENNDWQLVEIEDFAEFQFIQEKIRGHFGMQAGKVVEFWTAGIYDRTVSQWLWNRCRKRVQANMWAPPEPNSKGTEDCIGLYNNENYYLNDDGCFNPRFSICEGNVQCILQDSTLRGMYVRAKWLEMNISSDEIVLIDKDRNGGQIIG